MVRKVIMWKMMMRMLLGQVCPKTSDVRDALQVLRDYIPFSQNVEHIQQKLNTLK